MAGKNNRHSPRTGSGFGANFDETIDFIIGTPPVNPSESETLGRDGPSKFSLIHNAMPIVHIQPGIPNLTLGLDLMSRTPAFTAADSDAITAADLNRSNKSTSYVEQLAKLGFHIKQGKPGIPNHLTCAFLADSFPTDTFTNEYGENFLQKTTNAVSEGISSITQMMGTRSGSGTLDAGIKAGRDAGGMLKSGADAIATGRDWLEGMVQKMPDNSMLRRIVGNLDVLAAGGRIDFPMLWKNSTYSPSYTMTIRLYNPNPNSRSTTAKYIVGPVAALLLLGLPQSVGSGAYSWPYIHKFWAPGLYNLDPGYISNITVVKGGDQQQISWKQRMGVVDVRIDFGSVFNSILSHASGSRNRPTLKGYLSVLAEEKDDVIGLTDFQRANNETNQSPPTIQTSKNIGSNSGGLTNTEIKNYQKNITGQRADVATTQEKTMLDLTEVGEKIKARVTEDIKEIADNLIDLIPGGIRISF